MNDVLFGTVTIGTALSFLGGGLGVSILAQVLKRLFGLNSAKVIHFLVITLSFAASALGTVISSLHGNPTLLASHTASLLGIANAAHTFIVSDADAFLGRIRSALNSQPVLSGDNPMANDSVSITQPVQNTNTTPTADF